MPWQQLQQQQPPLSSQLQHDQQQQQNMTMSNPMMPPSTFHLSPGGNASLQNNAVFPPMGYLPLIRFPIIAETYQSRQSMGLGITLIIIGVLASIFNGVGFAVHDDMFAVIAHGFWCGVLFIVTGVFGVVAANKNKCLIVTFMVLSIISAVFSGALFGLGVTGALLNTQPYYRAEQADAAVAMESVLASLGVVAAIVSIWGSAICCRVVCCCGTAYSQLVNSPYGNHQAMIISQQQQLPVGTAQYAVPHMMPMGANPPHSAIPLPPQQWITSPPAQPGQQQLYSSPNAQQSYGYAITASSNGDQMPWTTVGQSSSVGDPPA